MAGRGTKDAVGKARSEQPRGAAATGSPAKRVAGERAGSGRKGATARAESASRGPAEDRFLFDEEALAAVEKRHPEGLTSAQVVEAFTRNGVRLTEATFRKWVQLGLLPRSRRVGRKGKHQGSLGLYPPSTVRRIAAIKRRMLESLTIEDIARSLKLREAIDLIERGLGDLFRGFGEELHGAAEKRSEGDQRQAERLLEQLEKQAAELVRRIGILERRLVEPLEREAKARAFGSGTSGGAADLL